MKIAHVVSTYPPYRGGMGNVAHEYVERLRARGENVHVFTPRLGAVIADDPEYVHRVPSPIHIGNAGVVPSLFRRLSGFDIVHLHYPFFGGAEPAIVRKALRDDQKLVVTYHMDTFANGLKGLIFEAHRRALFPWLMGRADRILVSSSDYAEHCSLAALPQLAGRIEALPFGVDTERFCPEETPSSFPLAGGDHPPTVLFVGGLDEAHVFKGVPVLLEALARIVDTPWQTLIVGDGDLRESYEADAARLRIADRVKFLGNVPDAKLPAVYRQADIHVLPSTTRGEAFGLVALEAAATAVPSIVSDLPGVRSVVLHGETGWRVPPGDIGALAEGLRVLLLDAPLRERLGLAARARALRDYAWEPLMDRLQEVYKSV